MFSRSCFVFILHLIRYVSILNLHIQHRSMHHVSSTSHTCNCAFLLLVCHTFPTNHVLKTYKILTSESSLSLAVFSWPRGQFAPSSLGRCPGRYQCGRRAGHGASCGRKSVLDAATFACACAAAARVFGRAARRERIAPCPGDRQSIHSVFPNSERRNGRLISGRPPASSSHISIKRRPRRAAAAPAARPGTSRSEPAQTRLNAEITAPAGRESWRRRQALTGASP